jgi:hypothetical protein
MISARDHVAHLAELDALAYVERFGGVFGAGPDDDAFIGEAWPTAVEDASLTEDEAAALLPVYRRSLRIETRRLTERRY